MDPTNPHSIPQTFSLHRETPAAPPNISNFPRFEEYKISEEGGKKVFAVPVGNPPKTYQAKIDFDLGMEEAAMVEAAMRILEKSNDSIPAILANFFYFFSLELLYIM